MPNCHCHFEVTFRNSETMTTISINGKTGIRGKWYIAQPSRAISSLLNESSLVPPLCRCHKVNHTHRWTAANSITWLQFQCQEHLQTRAAHPQPTGKQILSAENGSRARKIENRLGPTVKCFVIVLGLYSLWSGFSIPMQNTCKCRGEGVKVAFQRGLTHFWYFYTLITLNF